MNFRKLPFWDCCDSWEVLHPALGPQKRKLSNTFVLTDFSSGPQFTEKPAYRPSLELDQWDKEERSYLYLISCVFVTNGKRHGECSVAASFHTALCSSITLTSKTLLRSFYQRHLLESLFGGKKANNVFCQAAKQPVKDTAFWLHYLKERGNWILTTILNPSPRGRIIKELSITLVITVYLDNGKIKNWVVHQKWLIIFIRACNTWFVNTERGLVGMFLRFGPRCSSNGLGNRGVSLDLLLLLVSSNKASGL